MQNCGSARFGGKLNGGTAWILSWSRQKHVTYYVMKGWICMLNNFRVVSQKCGCVYELLFKQKASLYKCYSTRCFMLWTRADSKRFKLIFQIHVLCCIILYFSPITFKQPLKSSTWFLAESNDMLTDHSKLLIVWMFVCVSPVIGWQSVQGIPHLPPTDTWDQLQHPAMRNRISGLDNGCRTVLPGPLRLKWMFIFILYTFESYEAQF